MLKLIAFFIYLFFIFHSRAQLTFNDVLDSLKVELNGLPNGTHFSIARTSGGETIFAGFSVENDKLILTELKDSLFEIGSITKVFTSVILANEILSNKLNPLKSINKNFDFKFKNNAKINFLSLANHTSGMYRLPSNILVGNKNPNKPYENYSNELFENYLKDELDLGIKNHYNYSNAGMALLAYSLEKRTKTSFEQLLNEHIFNKYQMTSTGFEKQPSFPGYNAQGEAQEWWSFQSLRGAGGIVSSVKDLSKFVQAHFNPSDLVLSKTRESTFYISEEMSIGLSLHILPKENNQVVYWHNGGTAGFTSSMMFDVKQKKGVVILSNISPSNPKSSLVDGYCFQLLNATL